MANILEKPFDASKKIIRSIFKGTPNLFTTSDLNRQIEALKNQIDSINSLIAVDTDLTLSVLELGSNDFQLTPRFTRLLVNGCDFSDTPKVNLGTDTMLLGDSMYVYLKASKKTITYADDATHEIAGAKFSDGTSLASADQVVYYNPRIQVSSLSTVISDSDFVATLAMVTLSEQGSLIVTYNRADKVNTMILSNVPKLKSVHKLSSLRDCNLVVGDSLDDIANKLDTKISLYNKMEDDDGVYQERNCKWWKKGRNLFIELPSSISVSNVQSKQYKVTNINLDESGAFDYGLFNLSQGEAKDFFVKTLHTGIIDNDENFVGCSAELIFRVTQNYATFHIYIPDASFAFYVHREDYERMSLVGRNVTFDNTRSIVTIPLDF